MKHGVFTIALLTNAFAFSATAQLASWTEPIPKRDKPPVVFVTGHDAVCPDPSAAEIPYFQLTFGNFDKVMARDGRVSLVFEACYAPNRPPIEDIANVLGQLLSQLRHPTGEPVPEVDIVAHSMGGLIVRAYLAGKQSTGGFTPPATPQVRKIVFIGTPHFGTSVASPTSEDPQLREISLGSKFLFDLATWNQGAEDLRGIEALSIVGTGGRNGQATDSVVRVTSASMDFISPGRTAVLPYCHTQGGIGNLFLCQGAPGLARVDNEDHPTAQLVLAFLNDRDSWRSATEGGPNGVLRDLAGLMIQSRTADDVPRPIRSATFFDANGGATQLAISDAGIAYAELLPAGPGTLSIDGVTRPIALPAGGSRARVIKPGPYIESVEPGAGRSTLVLAPGMLVSITGLELNAGATELRLADKPLPVLSVSATRLVAVLPEDVVGLAELTVRNSAGQNTVRVLIENASPALFLRERLAAALHSSSGNSVSAADPAAPGEIISLFLTGLGATASAQSGLAIARQQPVVRVGNRPCEVLYAGRAPTLPGVDQINCRLASELERQAGVARIQITSGKRTATADLPVR